MQPKIQPITDPIELGEGPHWDSDNQCLYFVDINGSAVHKYDARTNSHFWANVGIEPVSIIIPIKDQSNLFAISYGNDLASIEWDGISEKARNLKTIARVDQRKSNRLNDGKVGPSGELMIGSMGRIIPKHKFDRKGSLYCYKDGMVNELFGDVGISNGLAWSLDQKYCFYVDTCRGEVTCFDYNPTTDPIITNGRTAFCFEATNVHGCPDGMTIDADGKLWVANYNGAEVLRIDPEVGKLLDRIKMPSTHITSVVFGGPNLDELYVTSAFLNPSGEKDDKFQHTGCLFRIIELGVKGTDSSPMIL